MLTNKRKELNNLNSLTVLHRVLEVILSNEEITNTTSKKTPLTPVIPYSEGDKMTEAEAAKFLGFCRKKLTAMRKKNEIPYSQISERKVYYSKIKLTSFLNKKEVGSSDDKLP